MCWPPWPWPWPWTWAPPELPKYVSTTVLLTYRITAMIYQYYCITVLLYDCMTV